MSRKDKKYNAHKTALLTNRAALKNMAVAFYANDICANLPIKLINIKGKEIDVKQHHHDAITNYRYRWFLYLVVGCRNSKGERELKIDYVPFTQPYFQSELVVYLNQRHIDFIEDLKAKNVKMEFAGWVASPSGRELNPEELYNIFERIGAWEQKLKEVE